MPISIQCPECRQEYKVDDKLAGKKVKCRECGAPIIVGGGEGTRTGTRAGTAAGTRAGTSAGTSAGSMAGAEAGGAPAKATVIRRCPSCRSPLSATATYCSACAWSATPTPTDEPGEAPAHVVEAVRRKRKWVRNPGNRTLNSIDGLLNAVGWLILIAGVTIWVLHIAKSPWGFNAMYLLPMGISLVALAFAGFLMNVGVKLASRFLEFPPRDDTLNRTLLVVMIPFGASLLAGWPGLDSSVDSAIVTFGWLLAPALLIYFFRAEALEWIASVGAAAVGLLAACLVLSAVAGPLGNAVALYRPMLPEGPWSAFATAPLEIPAPPKPPTTAVAAATKSATPSSTEPGFHFSVAKETSANVAEPTESTNGAPTTPTETAPPAEPEAYSFLTDVNTDNPAFRAVTGIRTGPGGSNWAVLAKTSDEGIVTLEHWTLDPLAHKGSVGLVESPVLPASFVVSPKGDTVVACTHLPREQIQVLGFESNKPPQIFPQRENPPVPPVAVAYLANINARVAIRAANILQFVDPIALRPTGNITLPGSVPDSPDATAVSPNSRYLAVVDNAPSGTQIIIYDPETSGIGMVYRRIQATSKPVERVIGLAFSPDGKQIALCAVMQQVTTILPFSVMTGAPAFSPILSTRQLVPANDRVKAPGLLWIQNGLAWLVYGDELFESTTGRKIGNLHDSNMIDTQLVGPNSVFLLEKTPSGGSRAVLAQFDTDKIRAAIDKLKQ